jgi:hypothetical protein
MPLGFWYWLILILWVVFGWWREYVPLTAQPHPWYRRFGWYFWTLVLLSIIGWKLFGSPLDALVTR